MEVEKEPLLVEVVPSQGDLNEGEALGTGGGEGVASIEVAPLEDSFRDLIGEGAVSGGIGVAITDWVVTIGQYNNTIDQ